MPPRRRRSNAAGMVTGVFGFIVFCLLVWLAYVEEWFE